MVTTPQERFRAAVALGMAASPFATTGAVPLVLIVGSTRKELKGCLIEYSCSEAPLEETGIMPGHRLEVHVPKKLVATKPNHELDALEYQGRSYKFGPVTGTEPFSPVWVMKAMSPIGS
jgi:hypothetical protein